MSVQKISFENSSGEKLSAELQLPFRRQPGDLTAEQKRRRLEIADKCPAHRTLEAKAHSESHLRG